MCIDYHVFHEIPHIIRLHISYGIELKKIGTRFVHVGLSYDLGQLTSACNAARVHLFSHRSFPSITQSQSVKNCFNYRPRQSILAAPGIYFILAYIR